MVKPPSIDAEFINLKPEAAPALVEFWRATFRRDPIDAALLERRVFGPPASARAGEIAALDERGAPIAVALLVPPRSGDPDRVGGLRAFGVHPAHRRRGLGGRLLEEGRRRLAALGAGAIDLGATPPYYLRPGVDAREVEAIAWLARRGFRHHRTVFNMSVDLAGVELPDRKTIFDLGADGFFIRRAGREERDRFIAFCERNWTSSWAVEAAQGIDADPSTLFIAVAAEGDRIAGFAAYEVNQGLGSFGPTGVAPEFQGRGLGRRLLWACLDDLRRRERDVGEIGWVGPVDFYQRVAGARLGPGYWWMRMRMGMELELGIEKGRVSEGA